MTKDAVKPLRRIRSSAALLVLLLVSRVAAIQPASWVHTTEADFEAGETENTVVTNLGDVKLAKDSKVTGKLAESATIIYDLEPHDDGLYIAAGPQAKLLRQTGEQIEEVLALDGEQIFALDSLEGKLLVAVSGAQSRLGVLEGKTLRTLIELKDVRYVWDIQVSAPKVYIATGTDGKLLQVNLDADEGPNTTELLDAEQANLLCLDTDKDGRLFVGTDTDGLIYRVTVNDDGQTEVFVVYDATEPEIGALLVMSDGTLFAGTADAEQARPGRLEEAAEEEEGRPEAETQPAGEPKTPPEGPAKPPKPEPIEENLSGQTQDKPETTEQHAPAEGGEDLSVEQPAKLPPSSGPQTESHAVAANNARPSPHLEQSAAPAPSHKEQGADEAEAAEEPTPEQYDRLRELISSQLQEAREKGVLSTATAVSRTRGRAETAAPSRARPAAAAATSKEGNAVYQIDPEGFVSEVFRESVMVLRIIETNGQLLVATGNEGQLFQVDPAAEETSTLIDLDAEQVTAMVRLSDESVLLGTANPAQIVSLEEKFARRGTYTSRASDAAQISQWGTLNLVTGIPESTSVMVETRSGNVDDPEKAPWSKWSAAQAFMPNADLSALDPRSFKIQSPPARFFQYRITLTGNGAVSPVVDRIDATYVTPNLRPKITSIKASYPEKKGKEDAAPPTILNVEWEATDPNEDPLIFKLEYQPAGSTKYLPLAEDLDETSYEWETRRVPDGRYVMRLTADDRRHNPPDMAMSSSRRSDPALVDNTPPAIEAVEQTVSGDSVTISGKAVDALSQIRSIGYGLDQTDDYKPVLPDDLIFDSTEEAWRVSMTEVPAMDHVVTIRVEDARGNTAYRSLFFKVQ